MLIGHTLEGNPKGHLSRHFLAPIAHKLQTTLIAASQRTFNCASLPSHAPSRNRTENLLIKSQLL